MRFFKKLFGLVSNSHEEDKRNDYARATFVYATSPRKIGSDAIIYSNQRLLFNTDCAHHRAVSNYSKTIEINKNNAESLIDVDFFSSHGQRISVTYYRSFTSTAYRLSTTQRPL
jgi:hypothetical protein